ncbi:MAG: nucleotidyltransferase family protein [Chloroflexi bacterium]|nr:nucleotidyltransferase family protein [Chloroflexota bacterium]
MKALILAAGKGTRISHLTQNCPKPMLPVGEKPLLAHLVHWLHSHHITEIAINLHYAPDAIINYFGDGSAYGVALTYSYEAQLLGTAGAAKQLEHFLNETFVVIYGDVYTNLNLTRLTNFHAARKTLGQAPALTLALYQVPNPTECGLVELDATNRVTRFVEKPPADQVFTNLANAGIMVCEPEILKVVPRNTAFDFGHNVLPRLLAIDAPIFGQAIADHEFLIDIGTPAGYQRAQQKAQTHSTAAAHSTTGLAIL